MCSINGFNFKDEKLIARMNEVTKHRGPDGTDVFFAPGVSLGHNRLAILDVRAVASQPMRSQDGRFVIVFNGEIYNFKELKKELPEYPFTTKSDTEVILAAYEKWGSECVKKLSGIFAFAIWDSKEQTLFLARDTVGVNPLYYYEKEGTLIFSSEIKAILEHNVPRKLSYEAFNHYLRVLYVPEPLSMFQGIYKFPKGSYGVVKNGKLSTTSYLESAPKKRLDASKAELKKELHDTVLQAVSDQLISDRPLGIYLSGGIDSSIVLHAASKVRSGIDTFSIGFELSKAEESDKFNKDFFIARETARRYGTKHHDVLLGADDAAACLEKAVFHLDEPISNPTIIPMLRLAEFTKRAADVVLGGDGGDELFGGYDRYRMSIASDYYQKLPAFIRRAAGAMSRKLDKLSTPQGIERFALLMFQKDAVLEQVIAPDHLDRDVTKAFFVPLVSPREHFEEVLMETDRKTWLPDFSLMLTNKMTMASGLEARVPLLDTRLIDFAERLPARYKVSAFGTKILLKDAFKDELPDYLFKEPKRGWFSPGAKWLRRPAMMRLAEEVLSDGFHAPTSSLFRFEGVRAILQGHLEKKEYNLTMLWALLTFQLWAKRYNVTLP